MTDPLKELFTNKPAPLEELFRDKQLVEKIKKKLPYMFHIAELESSRAGKVGMEVGSVRERIIVALLIYKFGEENVKADIPTTASEIDVKLFDEPVSIKTITGKNLSGVKLIWTVDTQKAREFQVSYTPWCDLLLVQINWGGMGGFYYIPLAVQKELFEKLGRERYIKLPKPGTNPRGVEMTREALLRLVEDERSKKIDICWEKTDIKFSPYTRWIDMWRED